MVADFLSSEGGQQGDAWFFIYARYDRDTSSWRPVLAVHRGIAGATAARGGSDARARPPMRALSARTAGTGAARAAQSPPTIWPLGAMVEFGAMRGRNRAARASAAHPGVVHEP